jgi:bifunctional non-homologous end joining protein LigD
VGTGFDQATLRELGTQLRELEQDESPFPPFKPIPPGTRWVRPELVAQIGFAEWTRDGRLRHPRFLGLRDDKPAGEVVREVPS